MHLGTTQLWISERSKYNTVTARNNFAVSVILPPVVSIDWTTSQQIKLKQEGTNFELKDSSK